MTLPDSRHLHVNLEGYVHLVKTGDRPRSSAHLARLSKKIRRHIEDCLIDFPEMAEGTIVLDGIIHWYTYARKPSGAIELFLFPRDHAEELLNREGFSTHEEWAPLPGSEHKH